MIEKALEAVPGLPMEPEIDIEVIPDGMEDEMLASLMDAVAPVDEHGSNIAEFLEESDLLEISDALLEFYDQDKGSRKDWEKAYTDGLDLLGTKYEDRDKPWPGACGVFHPVLTEAVVRFQAQAITELFPASGPVRTKILGKESPEKTAMARRVEDELNYQLTENIPEYRPELEQLLFRLPLAGSCFKKIYMDPLLERPTAKMVPIEDFIVPYGASDLRTASRYCHVLRMTSNDLKKMQASGFYVDADLTPVDPERGDVQEKHDELEGSEPTYGNDDRHVLLEYHIDYDLPGSYADPDGIACPYVITIDKTSGKVLSIYRNWKESDPKKQKNIWFIHYQYLPGLGFYGFGLIHLIGGLTKSSTSILRQLVDAGTLSNLPSGFKTKGLRIKGDNTPIMPGEFRDVDVPGSRIADSIHPLPIKEPSAVLFQLLGNIVDEARRIGSIADMDLGEMNPNAPVGTTLALLERSLKVMSAVHARLHHAMKEELRLIAKLIASGMEPTYNYESDGDRMNDFSSVEIIPVSDPNSATMAQRVMQYQAIMQLAQQQPEIYDLPLLHRSFAEALKIPNTEALIKGDNNGMLADPVTENMNLLMNRPIKVFMEQDHQAHIKVHMLAMKDPKFTEFLGQSPNAQKLQSAMEAHIAEHIAYAYRAEMEQMVGMPLPHPEEPIPPEMERMVSQAVAGAADALFERHKVEASQEAMESAMADPVFILQQKELDVKKYDAETKRLEVLRKAELDAANMILTQQTQILTERVEGPDGDANGVDFEGGDQPPPGIPGGPAIGRGGGLP